MRKNKFLFNLISAATVFGAASGAVASASMPFLPVAETHITSGFGMRIHPITGQEDFHSGVDLAATLNEPVESVLTGTVTQAGPRGLLGNAVEISHGRYGVSSIYGHLNKVLVHVGESVSLGTVIGLAGSTGRSTGPHVHFTIKRNDNGQDIEPVSFLQNVHDYPSRTSYLSAMAFLSNPVSSSGSASGSSLLRSQTQKALRMQALAASRAAIAKATSAEKFQQVKLATAEQYLSQAKLDANKFEMLYRAGAVSRHDAEAKAASAVSAQEEVASLHQQLGTIRSTIKTASSRIAASHPAQT